MKQRFPMIAGLALAAALTLAPAASQAQLLGGHAGGGLGGSLGGQAGGGSVGGAFGASGDLGAQSDVGGTVRGAAGDVRSDTATAGAQARGVAGDARATVDDAASTDASVSANADTRGSYRHHRRYRSAGGSADVDASTDVQPGAIGSGVRSTTRAAAGDVRSDAAAAGGQVMGAASNTTVSGSANVGGTVGGSVR